MRGCPWCHKRGALGSRRPIPACMGGLTKGPHLGREVDTGSPVEEQLGHVEVLVMSCDVEGGESRLAHNRGGQGVTSHVLSSLPQNQPGVLKSRQDQRTSHSRQIQKEGVKRCPTSITSKSEVLPLGTPSLRGSHGQTMDQGRLPPCRQGPFL